MYSPFSMGSIPKIRLNARFLALRYVYKEKAGRQKDKGASRTAK